MFLRVGRRQTHRNGDELEGNREGQWERAKGILGLHHEVESSKNGGRVEGGTPVGSLWSR